MVSRVLKDLDLCEASETIKLVGFIFLIPTLELWRTNLHFLLEFCNDTMYHI